MDINFVKIAGNSKIDSNFFKIKLKKIYRYLTIKIEEGNVNDIVCPQTDCFSIISHDIVESLVTKEIAQKYLHFDLKVKWLFFWLILVLILILV